MRRNSTSSIGAFHPVLFFLVIYGISLFMALFVCRTVYYSLNKEESVASNEKPAKPAGGSFTIASTNVTAFR